MVWSATPHASADTNVETGAAHHNEKMRPFAASAPRAVNEDTSLPALGKPSLPSARTVRVAQSPLAEGRIPMASAVPAVGTTISKSFFALRPWLQHTVIAVKLQGQSAFFVGAGGALSVAGFASFCWGQVITAPRLP